jgi:drug/metabolite transporter (DMT)-like permease
LNGAIILLNRRAVLFALASAALFGASTPLAKALVGNTDPFILAGLLYLGAGLGVAALRWFAPNVFSTADARESLLTRAELPWLAGAIAAGGVAGPILLMLGLAHTDAASASLLLTLEGVATALIAWFVFRENFDKRIAIGMALLVAGALVLSWTGKPSLSGLAGPLAIVAACIAWGIDNNLTRKVSLSDPLQIVQLKGLVAGPINLALGLLAGGVVPAPPIVVAGMLVGFLGYGVSLVCFVLALRHLGSARTGAYFSTAPFLGTIVAIIGLHDPLTWQIAVAGALMAGGVWLHLTEHHEHEHEHDVMEHSHPHVHDAHHQHTHEAGDPPGEPHTHHHRHEKLKHSHAHAPDMHHVHRH